MGDSVLVGLKFGTTPSPPLMFFYLSLGNISSSVQNCAFKSYLNVLMLIPTSDCKHNKVHKEWYEQTVVTFSTHVSDTN